MVVTKSEAVGNICPLCGNKETIRADFDSQNCKICNFYWWFWLDMDRLIEAKENHLASLKADKERFSVPDAYISKCESDLVKLKNIHVEQGG